MNKKYFDQRIGSQTNKVSKEEAKITKRILDAYIKEQPLEDIQENRRVGIKLSMQTYLNEGNKEIILTGEFLKRLLDVYNINKLKFAEHIGYENANLHALLKGRRKFNSKLASIIGPMFKIDPELWMFIEAKNELKSFTSKNKLKFKKVNLLEMSRNR